MAIMMYSIADLRSVKVEYQSLHHCRHPLITETLATMAAAAAAAYTAAVYRILALAELLDIGYWP